MTPDERPNHRAKEAPPVRVDLVQIAPESGQTRVFLGPDKRAVTEFALTGDWLRDSDPRPVRTFRPPEDAAKLLRAHTVGARAASQARRTCSLNAAHRNGPSCTTAPSTLLKGWDETPS